MERFQLGKRTEMNLGETVLLRYFDSYGFIQGKTDGVRGEPEGNTMLTTAEGAMMLYLRGELMFDRKLALYKALELLRIWPAGKEEAHLYIRHPDAFTFDQQSVDNFVGWAILATLLDPAFAVEWLAAGKRGWRIQGWAFRLGFYFPNEPQYRGKLGWQAWFPPWKSSALHCAMRWAAEAKDYPARWYHKLGWIVTVATSGMWAKNQDPFKLTRLLIFQLDYYKRRRGVFAWAAGVHERRRLKKYPRGMAEVYAWYFRENDQAAPNWDHWAPVLAGSNRA